MVGTNLFGIGMPELIFIAIIALIVLGPQRLPGVMREVAKFIAQIRGLTSELTSQFSEEIAMLEDLDPRKIIDEVTQPVKDAVKPLNDGNSANPKTTKPKAKATTSSSKSTDAKSTDAKSTADESAEVASTDSSETKSQDAGSEIIDGKEVDQSDSKPKAQTQTDPANVASTSPYTNRTANKNLIKRPEKKETSDSESDSPQLDSAQPEENQIASPQMQENFAQAAESASKATHTAGSTAGKLLAGKQAYSNEGSTNEANSVVEKLADENSLSDSSTIDPN